MGVELEPEQLAKTLRDVQALDTKIFGLQREIQELRDKHHLGDLAGELAGVRQEQAVDEESLQQLEHKQHKLDGELDLLVTKMKKEEEKLFSGTIMNPKELSAIQAEILSLRKKRDEMETEDLEEMEEIDRLTDGVDSAKRRTAEIVAKERVATDAYDEELSDMQAEIAALEMQRDNLKKNLDKDVLADYEKLLREKAGIAVVPIVQGRTCGGCHIDFSRTQIDKFQHNEGWFRCEYCRRILVK
jgi:predicted  nucleic acid-binding Zn-ribbon protein